MGERDADPFIASDPGTGDIWFGGCAIPVIGHPNGIYLARKLAGASAFLAPVTVVHNPPGNPSPILDEATMAIGPRPGVPGARNLYVVFAHLADVPSIACGPPICNPLVQPCANLHLMVARSRDLGAPGSWELFYVKPPNHPLNVLPNLKCYYGGGVGQSPALPAAVVLPSGRLVVIFRNDPVGPWAGTFVAVYSDGEGESSTWSQPPLDLFPGVTMQEITWGDVPGAFPVQSWSSASVDSLTDDIYVAVPARRAPGYSNTDIWIARLRNQGTLADPPVRLPLDLVDLAYAPDQFMSALVVNRSCGELALHLLYYDNVNHITADTTEPGYADVYYARITQFDPFNPGAMQILRVRLTAQTFATEPPIYEEFLNDPGSARHEFIGDYVMMDGGSNLLYPCYVDLRPVGQPPAPQRHYYVNRIDTCPADMDASGEVHSNDFGLFHMTYYPAGDPRADMNADGIVSPADAAAFNSEYSTTWSPP